MRTLSLTLLLALICSVGFAQNKHTDSLHRQFFVVKNDTNRVWVLAELCSNFRYSNTDSSIFYGEKALSLARKIKFLRGEANTLNRLSLTFTGIGDFPKALELQYSALKISEDNNFQLEKAACLRRMGFVYTDLKNYSKAIGLFLTALKIDSTIKNKGGVAIAYNNLGLLYQATNNADSALYYNQKAFNELSYYKDMAAELYRVRGDIEAMKGDKASAVKFYQQGIQITLKNNDYRNSSFIYSNLAAIYKQMNQPDSSIYYALKGVESGQRSSFKKGILLSANLLAQLYDSVSPNKSLYYYKIATAVKDSLFGAGNVLIIQAMVTKEEARQKEIELAKTNYQNKLKQYGLTGGLGVLCIIAFILYRNNLQKQKANKVLETTLKHLKTTQTQLIQSEKLASLGELTAGIAHEIQNPLNFVNNFSEVSVELLEELKSPLTPEGGIRPGEKMDMEIFSDLSQNLEKITEHGKRASSIVKGMLEHSRASTGVKELTDINALADEYLRLAYHGLRAKDPRDSANKDFNSDFKTDFDPNLPKINVIPQDIGRVLLNLINNAFYAVRNIEKPLVTLSTEKSENQIIIKVKDNGTGITDEVKSKIFQPFFTTKPTGQGTGLGLSLAYDIVTKGHGGTIECESAEGEGTTFVVKLSIT